MDRSCIRCGVVFSSIRAQDLCPDCRKRESRKRAYLRRKERESVLRDCGLVKVRGALGGVYWE